MINKNENYIKYVKNDLKNHSGLFHPVKAGILLRIKQRKVSPKRLHPNPDDEFSWETVGPNWEIISKYEQDITLRLEKDQDIFDEPLYAVKLDKGGYMLLNGHHRWLAAINRKIKKVPIKVVNTTTVDDITEIIRKSERTKCVTIDFDEVLFSDEFQNSNLKISFPLNKIYKKNIRNNASYAIREFARLGFDIWVYTGSYLSEQYIKGLFSINKCSVDGVVNGINGKNNSKKLRELFRNKYNYIVHVSNESVTLVDTKTKDYQIIDINANNDDWASIVAASIKELNI